MAAGHPLEREGGKRALCITEGLLGLDAVTKQHSREPPGHRTPRCSCGLGSSRVDLTVADRHWAQFRRVCKEGKPYVAKNIAYLGYNLQKYTCKNLSFALADC